MHCAEKLLFVSGLVQKQKGEMQTTGYIAEQTTGDSQYASCTNETQQIFPGPVG